MVEDLGSVGTCELVAETLRITEELRSRDLEEFDELDAWRLTETAENILSMLNKILSSRLAMEERMIASNAS